MLLDAGDGRDKVILKKLHTMALAVEMQGGDQDLLKIAGCTADVNYLDGGDGTGDKLAVKGSNLGTASPMTPTGFE